MPSGQPLPGKYVPALTPVNVRRCGSVNPPGTPIDGPAANAAYSIRPAVQSPIASVLLSGETAMPFGNCRSSMILRRIPSLEYWYTAPARSDMLGPGPVAHGSVK